MANNGEIVIRFEEGPSSQKPKSVDTTGETKKSDGSSDVLETTIAVVAMKKAANMIKNVTVKEAKYQLNKYYMLNDDYLGQQNLNIGLGVVEKVVSTGLGIAGAIKAGAMIGGPVGALVMGGIALIGSGVETGLQISHNYQEERIQMAKMNAQLQFNRERAGYSLTAGSIGENR